ncbi:MAG TPA: hypothetical protein VMT67_14485 [Terriglobales bacterium]|nr:hypothetical protein [Terriglobales bacterium]
MFEQELEMEKKTSSIVPLLLIVGLIVGIAGVAIHFVLESRKALSTAEATPVLQASLESLGPATLHFDVGTLSSATSQNAADPHYRLLEKEGYLKIGKTVKDKTPVELTPKGEAWLNEIPGVKKSKNQDNNDEYVVPLANRKLVAVDKITMTGPGKAAVEYSWNWVTTKGGDLFDASGPAVKAFNTWDRSKLIDKYGAAFYHADPTKVTVLIVSTDKGWQPSKE